LEKDCFRHGTGGKKERDRRRTKVPSWSREAARRRSDRSVRATENGVDGYNCEIGGMHLRMTSDGDAKKRRCLRRRSWKEEATCLHQRVRLGHEGYILGRISVKGVRYRGSGKNRGRGSS